MLEQIISHCSVRLYQNGMLYRSKRAIINIHNTLMTCRFKIAQARYTLITYRSKSTRANNTSMSYRSKELEQMIL